MIRYEYITHLSRIGDIFLSKEERDCDEMPGLMSKETLKAFLNFANVFAQFFGYLGLIMCIFGVFINIVGVYALTRKNMASCSNIILTWVGVANLIIISVSIPYLIYFSIIESEFLASNDFTRSIFTTQQFWGIYLIVYMRVSQSFQNVGTWLIIALSIFRYINVQYPFKASIYCSKARAKYTVVAILFLEFCTISPWLVLIRPTYIDVPINQTTIPNENVTLTSSTLRIYLYDLRRCDCPRLYKFYFWLRLTFAKVVPSFLLIVVTVMLLHAMHAAYYKTIVRRSIFIHPLRQIEYKRTTFSIFIIALMYLVSVVPFSILNILDYYVECASTFYMSLHDLTEFVHITINSLLFLLYFATSAQFRKAVGKIFCSSYLDTQSTTVITITNTASTRVKHANKNDMGIDSQDHQVQDDETTHTIWDTLSEQPNDTISIDNLLKGESYVH